MKLLEAPSMKAEVSASTHSAAVVLVDIAPGGADALVSLGSRGKPLLPCMTPLKCSASSRDSST